MLNKTKKKQKKLKFIPLKSDWYVGIKTDIHF